jgi:predicted anti-sigma-YlaC factor YlaD
LLDQYVELAAHHEDAAEILPLVKDHLDRCHNCREEYEALARIIAASSSSELL